MQLKLFQWHIKRLEGDVANGPNGLMIAREPNKIAVLGAKALAHERSGSIRQMSFSKQRPTVRTSPEPRRAELTREKPFCVCRFSIVHTHLRWRERTFGPQ